MSLYISYPDIWDEVKEEKIHPNVEPGPRHRFAFIHDLMALPCPVSAVSPKRRLIRGAT
jgi:hypothetical protein